MRKSQFAELKKFIDAQNFPQDQPLFVAGDFNVIAGTAEEDAVFQVLDAVKPQFSGGPSFAKRQAERHSTNSFRTLGHRRCTFTDYSDHYPVFASK